MHKNNVLLVLSALLVLAHPLTAATTVTIRIPVAGSSPEGDVAAGHTPVISPDW